MRLIVLGNNRESIVHCPKMLPFSVNANLYGMSVDNRKVAGPCL